MSLPTGEGGLVHSQGGNIMTAPGLSRRKALACTGWPISDLFGINGLGNKLSHLIGPAFKAHFSAALGWHFPRALIENSLSAGCG